MNRLTGNKRKNAPGVNEPGANNGEAPQSPPTSHQTPLKTTSRHTVHEVFRGGLNRDEPPEFPEEPLLHHLGVLALLPPSVLDNFLRGVREPFMFPPKDIVSAPPEKARPAAAITESQADAGLAEQLGRLCDLQTKSTGRPSAAVRLLRQPKPLSELITDLITTNEHDQKMALGLLTLLQWCDHGSQVHTFIMSLFLVMRRQPDEPHREGFTEGLPSALSPLLQAHAQNAQVYWVDSATNPHRKRSTRALATEVCEHLGWSLDPPNDV